MSATSTNAAILQPDPNGGSIRSALLSTQRTQSQQQLQIKLGSLYHRIYQLHNEQYNIYPPFNNYEQYRIYCTQRLSRLRHCNYKMTVTKELPSPLVMGSDKDDEGYADSAKKEIVTTTTVVKSLLLHISKYSNAIPAVQSVPAMDTAVTASKQSSNHQHQANSQKRGGGSKHAYHSRKIVYENILHLSESGCGDTEEVKEKASGDFHTMDIYYHENVIWNLFYQAERAWAQACSLLLVHQQQQSSPSTAASSSAANQYKKKLSNHRHVQNRFNKAVYWSQLLYNTAQALLSTLSSSETQNINENGGTAVMFVQECYAYMKWMEGNAAIEHKDYVSAYKSYSHSIQTLYHLPQYHRTADELSLSLLPQPTNIYHEKWKWHVENVLRPLVRYCQYEMKGMDMNHHVEGEENDILQLIDQQQGSKVAASTSSSSTTKICFRNVDVTFDNQLFSQQITVSYLKLEPLLSSLVVSTNDSNDDDESTRSRLMSDLDDLMSFVMKEYKMKFHNQSSSVAAPQQQQLSFITFYSYLKYYKLSIWRRQQEKRIKETLNASSSSKSNDTGTSHHLNSILPDMIHLYTTLQQIVLSMNELIPTAMMSTAMTTSGTQFDEDDPYTLEAQAHIVRVRAFRCYYMAQYNEMIGISYSNDNMNGEQQKRIMSNNLRTFQQQQYVASRLLLQQSQLLTKRAIEETSACEDDATLLLSSQLINTYVTELEQLNTHIKAMFCRLDATYYLYQQQFGSSTLDTVNNVCTAKSLSTMTPSFPLNPDRPLWMRYYEENDEDGKNGEATWADVPPLPIPLPCKGVFFDLAVQYIDEIIHDEVVRPLLEHSKSSCNTSVTDSRTNDTATTSKNIGFRGWFSSK